MLISYDLEFNNKLVRYINLVRLYFYNQRSNCIKEFYRKNKTVKRTLNCSAVLPVFSVYIRVRTSRRRSGRPFSARYLGVSGRLRSHMETINAGRQLVNTNKFQEPNENACNLNWNLSGIISQAITVSQALFLLRKFTRSNQASFEPIIEKRIFPNNIYGMFILSNYIKIIPKVI
jgi:hypothetical protein